MSKQYVFLALVFLMFIGWKAYANGYLGPNPDGAQHIDVHQAKYLIDNGADVQVLDVRTPGEWSSGIIENSILINLLDKEFDQKVSQLSKDRPVVIICRSGSRSNTAMRSMVEMGFEELYNVRGGINSWNRAGFELKL
ncbi:MAG: rhodanese-like domain-containing protein [Saprospirales bacterium]|nr:MAG: rhodanese-like domain-containing protein [Saprospirales bacterium]